MENKATSLIESLTDNQSIRRRQEIQEVTGTRGNRLKYYNYSLQDRGEGEYVANYDHKVERIKFLAEHPDTHLEDKKYFQKSVHIVNKFEKMGLQFGTIFGLITFFLPGIRRTPFYIRIPISSAAFLYCIKWGNEFGKDIAYEKTRPNIEAYDRYRGTRNFFTGF